MAIRSCILDSPRDVNRLGVQLQYRHLEARATLCTRLGAQPLISRRWYDEENAHRCTRKFNFVLGVLTGTVEDLVWLMKQFRSMSEEQPAPMCR